jgi:glutathione S-transferase
VKLFERGASETDTDVGLWKDGGKLSLADVMVGPCMLIFLSHGRRHVLSNLSSGLFRATNVLAHYRGFAFPEGEKTRAYLHRLLSYPAFKRTCSTEDLYLESYER